MKFTIRSVPRFEFELTRKQLVMLTRASTLHYDYTCRSLSTPPTIASGSPQGLLVGWHNHQEFVRAHSDCGPATLNATWRELDLCLKCMEMPLPHRAYDAERFQLTFDFHQMMNAWEAHHKAHGRLEGETK